MLLLLSVLVFVSASDVINFIVNRILKSVFRKPDHDIARENEFKEIKEKLEGMSRPDNFAAYARLERRLNKLKTQITDANTNRIETMNSFSLVINWLVNLIWFIVGFFLVTHNLNTPVIFMDENWFYPIHGIISWPSVDNGCVGFLCWYLTVKTTMNTIKHCFF